MSIQTDNFDTAERVISAGRESPQEELVERALRPKAQVFSLFTTTARPSLAITISVKSIPASAQAFFSSSLMAREAFEMSVSPAQNFLKPPPVPLVPTVTRWPGFFFWNSSATQNRTAP